MHARPHCGHAWLDGNPLDKERIAKFRQDEKDRPGAEIVESDGKNECHPNVQDSKDLFVVNIDGQDT